MLQAQMGLGQGRMLEGSCDLHFSHLLIHSIFWFYNFLTQNNPIPENNQKTNKVPSITKTHSLTQLFSIIVLLEQDLDFDYYENSSQNESTTIKVGIISLFETFLFM